MTHETEFQVCDTNVQRGINPKPLASSVLHRHLQRLHPGVLPREERLVTSGRKKRPVHSQQGEVEGGRTPLQEKLGAGLPWVEHQGGLPFKRLKGLHGGPRK